LEIGRVLIRSAAELVHAREHLRDHPPLHLALRVLALRRNGIDLVDEEQRGRLG